MTRAYHDNIHRPARMTTGEVYVPRPADSGLCRTMSCIRCGSIKPLAALAPDKLIRHQWRCAVSCAKGSA